MMLVTYCCRLETRKNSNNSMYLRIVFLSSSFIGSFVVVFSIGFDNLKLEVQEDCTARQRIERFLFQHGVSQRLPSCPTLLTNERGISFKTIAFLWWCKIFELYRGVVDIGCRPVKVLFEGEGVKRIFAFFP